MSKPNKQQIRRMSDWRLKRSLRKFVRHLRELVPGVADVPTRRLRRRDRRVTERLLEEATRLASPLQERVESLVRLRMDQERVSQRKGHQVTRVLDILCRLKARLPHARLGEEQAVVSSKIARVEQWRRKREPLRDSAVRAVAERDGRLDGMQKSLRRLTRTCPRLVARYDPLLRELWRRREPPPSAYPLFPQWGSDGAVSFG